MSLHRLFAMLAVCCCLFGGVAAGLPLPAPLPLDAAGVALLQEAGASGRVAADTPDDDDPPTPPDPTPPNGDDPNGSPPAPAPPSAENGQPPDESPAPAPSAAPVSSPVSQAPAPVDAGPRPGPLNTVMPLFSRPFKDEFRATNYFDHDLPFEHIDTNGYQMTAWGKRVWKNVDGHNGIDYNLTEGTPILAAADGKVVQAGAQKPWLCPTLHEIVSGLGVTIDHAAEGDRPIIQSGYWHFSWVDVKVGQTVKRGDQLGLSGNTGCSTAPHLHFQALRRVGKAWVRIDPYGWEGTFPDPSPPSRGRQRYTRTPSR